MLIKYQLFVYPIANQKTSWEQFTKTSNFLGMVRDRLQVSVLTLSVFDQINHLLHLLMISIVLYFVNYRRWILICLKFVSAIFYQIFIFSPKDSTLKTMKNVFCFIWKALFVLEIFKFLYFFLLPFHFFQIQKDKWKRKKLWCHELTCVNLQM